MTRRDPWLCAALIAPLLSTGCPSKVGACGEAQTREGTVTITSIEAEQWGETKHYRIQFAGFFDESVTIPQDQYQRCIEQRGHQVGSELRAKEWSHGPCPGGRSIDDCIYL